jgi:hypothetical protein
VHRPEVETTLTLILTEEEALAVYAVLNTNGSVLTARRANSAVYEVLNELEGALRL